MCNRSEIIKPLRDFITSLYTVYSTVDLLTSVLTGLHYRKYGRRGVWTFFYVRLAWLISSKNLVLSMFVPQNSVLSKVRLVGQATIWPIVDSGGQSVESVVFVVISRWEVSVDTDVVTQRTSDKPALWLHDWRNIVGFNSSWRGLLGFEICVFYLVWIALRFVNAQPNVLVINTRSVKTWIWWTLSKQPRVNMFSLISCVHRTE